MAIAPNDVATSEVDTAIRLVSAHRSGDRDAFEEIVRTHYTTLLACAQRHLGNVHDAQDAVQDTLARALRGLDGFGNSGDWQLGAWLNKILSNVCLDTVGRRKPTVSLDDWMRDSAQRDVQPDIADAAADPIVLGAIQRAIAALPEARRQAFVLRMVDDLSYCEVAGQMGISEDNTRALVSRARRDLRKILSSAAALSGTLAAAPLFFTSSLRSGLRRIFSSAAGDSTRAAGGQVVASGTLSSAANATSSAVPAMAPGPMATGVQVLSQMAASPLAQAAMASTAATTGRSSVVLGIVASLATAGGLSVPAMTAQSPAAPVAAAVTTAQLSTQSPATQISRVVGRMQQSAAGIGAGSGAGSASAPGSPATTTTSAGGTGSPAATVAPKTTAWITLAATAAVDSGAATKDTATPSSSDPTPSGTGSTTAGSSSTTTATGSSSTTTATGSTTTSPTLDATSTTSASTTTGTTSGTTTTGSTTGTTTTGSTTGTTTGSTTGTTTTGSTTGTTTGTTTGAPAGAPVVSLPAGSCAGVNGFSDVQAPTSVPALTSSLLSAILSTGAMHLAQGATAPSFAGTASVKVTGGSSTPVQVKVGTCLAATGSLLAVDMTGSTGAEVQGVGSLVSEPSGASIPGSTSLTYLFRGSMSQIAGTTPTGGQLPWGIPKYFVAELQVDEPADTGALTVVFLQRVSQPAPAEATPGSSASPSTTGTSPTTGTTGSTQTTATGSSAG